MVRAFKGISLGMAEPDLGGRGVLRAIDCVESPRDAAMVHEFYRGHPNALRGLAPDMREAIIADLDAGRKRGREIMDGSEDAETALAGLDRIVTASRAALVIDGQAQADRHHVDKLAQDDKHLAASWADTLSKVPPDELIAAAIRLGMVDKLPPAMREQAKARMGK